MSTLERAIEIATEAHRGQFDKEGNDYIGHPLRVMAAGKTTEEKIVGVLHDVVEDSGWSFERLAAEGFSQEVIEALRCVTKLSENEPYDKFIARIKTNPLAVAVKLNDLTDNMDMLHKMMEQSIQLYSGLGMSAGQIELLQKTMEEMLRLLKIIFPVLLLLVSVLDTFFNYFICY